MKRSMNELTVRLVQSSDPAVCEKILRSLPEWFGIEESLVQYARDTSIHPTWIAEHDGTAAGFITLRRHYPHAAEVHCMGVLPRWHRRGVGGAMIQFVEERLRGDGCEFLQVKTLGQSRPDDHYELTRRFYESQGFRPLEEFSGLWPGNPCLLMVKRL